MKMGGWVLEGDHLRFSDDSNIIQIMDLLKHAIHWGMPIPMPDKQGEQSSAAALASTRDSDGMCEIPPEYRREMFISIGAGDSVKLHSLLEQIKIPAGTTYTTSTLLKANWNCMDTD